MGAGNQHSFTLTDVRSGSAVAGGLPLAGPIFTGSPTNAGNITLTKSGSSPLSNIKAGGASQKIGEFRMAVDSVEHMTLVMLELTLGGTVSRSKVTNITLKQAGATVASAPGYNVYDRATMVLGTPMLIEKGNTKTFDVYADIDATVRNDETIFTYFDDTSDITLIGSNYSFAGSTLTQTAYGGSYDGTSCALGAGNCSTTKVNAGQFTLSFNGPAAKDVASNGKDVEIFNFTMAAQSNLEIRKTRLTLDSTVSNLFVGTARFTDIKIVDTATGATVAGPKDVTATALTENLDFTEVYNLNAGQARTFKVTADIANDAASTMTVKVTLGKFSTLSSAIRNLDNSTFLGSSDIVPDAVVAGNAHTVRTPSLTLSVSSTPVSQSYIQGSQGVSLIGIGLKAGDGGDVKVNSLKVTAYVDENTTGTFTKGTDTVSTASDVLLTAKLWNGSTQVGDTKSPTSGTGGEMTFENLNLTIPKGQNITLTLSGNVASSIASVVATSDRIKFDVTANADVSATDVDGNSITATGAPVNGTTADSGIRMTIASAGTVTVALSPDDVESEAGNVVGGSTNVVLGKYKFTAQNEELKLAKARFNTASPTAVSSVSLYDGATLVGGPVSVDGSGNADFSGMSFVIAKDSSKVLTVKGNLNTVGASGATTGVAATVSLMNTASTFEVRGTSAGSSTLITTNGVGTIAARAKIVRKTKITVTNAALPSSVLNDGTMVLSRVTVAANASGDAAIKKLTYNVTKSNAIGITVPVVRDVNANADIAATPTLNAACAAAGGTACVITIVFTNENQVSAASDKTYELRASVGTTAASTSIQTVLASDSALVSGELETTGNNIQSIDPVVVSTAYNFIWSDISAVPHNDTAGGTAGDDAGASNDWTNGLYVKTLPTDSQTLTRS